MVVLNSTLVVRADPGTTYQLAEIMLDARSQVLHKCLKEDIYVSSVACVASHATSPVPALGFRALDKTALLPSLTNWRLLTPDFLALCALSYHVQSLYQTGYVSAGPDDQKHSRVLHQWLALHHFNLTYTSRQN